MMVKCPKYFGGPAGGPGAGGHLRIFEEIYCWALLYSTLLYSTLLYSTILKNQRTFSNIEEKVLRALPYSTLVYSGHFVYLKGFNG